MIHQQLLLYFPDADQRRICQLMLHYLAENNIERARHWAQELGADLSESWLERWFNPRFSAAAKHLCVEFQTLSAHELPLADLRSLFNVGLRAAVLEVRAGAQAPVQRFHLLEGMKVSAHKLRNACPDWALPSFGDSLPPAATSAETPPLVDSAPGSAHPTAAERLDSTQPIRTRKGHGARTSSDAAMDAPGQPDLEAATIAFVRNQSAWRP
jgi:hypothetical protein